MKKYLSEIKKELSIFELKTNEELSNEIEKLKKRSKVEGLENIIEPWFAIVQEIT